MPKVVDHDARRAEVLDQAYRLMADEGYGAATMRRIARAAGVSTGTLYHYFPDKPAILDGMFERLIGQDQARVTAAIPEAASPAERVRVLFAFLRDEAEHFRALLRLALEVHRHEPEEDSRARVQEAVAGYRAAVADVLDLDPALAHAAFSFIVGGLWQGIVDPRSVDLDRDEGIALGFVTLRADRS